MMPVNLGPSEAYMAEDGFYARFYESLVPPSNPWILWKDVIREPDTVKHASILERLRPYTVLRTLRSAEAFAVPISAEGLDEFLRECLRTCDALGNSDIFGTPVVSALVQAYWERSCSERLLAITCAVHLCLLLAFVGAIAWSSWVFEALKLALLVPLVVHEACGFGAALNAARWTPRDGPYEPDRVRHKMANAIRDYLQVRLG
ncbi:hypothetical protein JKP88DRAFT_255887 [Tribonema minus]|nr:hypothetical protein JKP88DRAFT_255887 [Tribonema minus]